MNDDYPEKEILQGPDGITIELDATEIDLDDPGAGTPVMVIDERRHLAGTFHAVIGEGEFLDGELPNEEQLEWLNDHEQYVDDWFDHWIEVKKGPNITVEPHLSGWWVATVMIAGHLRTFKADTRAGAVELATEAINESK